MKFFHENVDGRNSCPSPADDKIIEPSWKEALKRESRNNTKTSGWIAPNENFFGCGYGEHGFLAMALFDSSCTKMQANGYCMIYWDSWEGDFDYCCDTPLTAAQKEVLQKKGVKIKEKDKEEDV